MLFNSLSFLIYFPLVTAGYFLLPQRFRWAWLLAASCYFYMAFVPAYILILFFTIAVDYAAGLLIESAQGRRRKMYLIASLLANGGVLAFFKYFNFLNANTAALADALGWTYGVPALNILLPIGLSFHTFQSMSYTIEVYRGRQAAERHFGIFALYVMFYPQLVAGPIERPQHMLPQFRAVHRFDYGRAARGLKLMLWGFFKKVVIADTLAVVVNHVYDAPRDFDGPALVLATVFFAFQIFCDFSGYSDIALGSAEVMGFRLMTNFDRPYLSRSIGEFWRRWHISLSTWFKDYLYIPLGGSRVSKPRQSFNLMVTFLVSGLWHGANWTYVAWGGLNGFYLACSLWTKPARERLCAALHLNPSSRVLAFFQWATTFALVTVAWVFFRARNLSDAFSIFARFFSGWNDVSGLGALLSSLALPHAGWYVGTAFLSIGFMEVLHRWQGSEPLLVRLARAPVWLRWSVYHAWALWIVVVLIGNRYMGRTGNVEFIYFQF